MYAQEKDLKTFFLSTFSRVGFETFFFGNWNDGDNLKLDDGTCETNSLARRREN